MFQANGKKALLQAFRNRPVAAEKQARERFIMRANQFSPPSTEIRGELLRAYNESERLIKEAERERITAISRTTWWRRERSGEVPRRKKVGGSAVWLLSDLLAWMQK